MRQAGVNMQQFHPIRPWECRYGWRPFNRDHRKLLVIDDHVGGLGGLNVGAQYAGSWIVQDPKDSCCDFWRDNAIGMVGPSVKLLLRSFANTWRYVQSGGRIRKAELVHNIELADRSARLRAYRRRQARRIRRFRLRLARFRLRHHLPDDGDGHATAPTDSAGVRLELPHHRASPLAADFGLVASVPTASSPLGSMFRKLFRGAQRSIQLTMAYFAPSDVFIGELCRAARRGVKVQLMLPAECDVHLLMVAARSFYDTLMSAGVEIFERQGAVLHAKTMVIDGETTVIGSTNLDYRSIEYNCELSAILRSREFGRQMQDLFANDVCYAKRILPGEWRRRPVRDRVVQWAVQRARYLL
jgi:cardiolipin synthase